MLQHGASLPQGNPWKPFDEISELRAILQILKEGRHGDARSSKHPGAADPSRITLDRGARRPVNHHC